MCKEVKDTIDLEGKGKTGWAAVVCSRERAAAVRRVVWQRRVLAGKGRKKKKLQFKKE